MDSNEDGCQPGTGFSTVHVCECLSFGPSDWTYTSSQHHFPGSQVKPYYISRGDSEEPWPCTPSLFGSSWIPYIDSHVGNNYVLTCGLQWGYLCLPFHLCFFVLLRFHSSHPSPLASQCDSIYPSWRGSAACLGGRCDEVKNFHPRVQILSGPVRDMAPHMHRDPEGTDLMRTPEWGYCNELFSVLALGKHTVTTLALLEVPRDLILWPHVC